MFRDDGVPFAGRHLGLKDAEGPACNPLFQSFASTHSRAGCCLAAALHCTAQEVLRRQTLKTFMKYRCNNVKNYQQWAEIVHEVSDVDMNAV